MSVVTRRGSAAVLGLVAAGLLAFAACGGENSESEVDGGGDGGPATINATLGGSAGEFSLTVDPDSASAGKVRFNVTNEGESEHEFELFKTDVAAEQIPVAGGKANLEAVEAEEIDEVEDLEAGDSAELEADLEAGTYLIICNLPAHFEQGMHTGFTVG